jgi:hypothetical protein
VSAFGGIADIASSYQARKKPAPRMGPAWFPGSGGPLWALLAHSSEAPLVARQMCRDRWSRGRDLHCSYYLAAHSSEISPGRMTIEKRQDSGRDDAPHAKMRVPVNCDSKALPGVGIVAVDRCSYTPDGSSSVEPKSQ